MKTTTFCHCLYTSYIVLHPFTTFFVHFVPPPGRTVHRTADLHSPLVRSANTCALDTVRLSPVCAPPTPAVRSAKAHDALGTCRYPVPPVRRFVSSRRNRRNRLCHKQCFSDAVRLHTRLTAAALWNLWLSETEHLCVSPQSTQWSLWWSESERFGSDP